MDITIQILTSPYGFVAQCLEHDIAAQGKSPEEAIYRLEKTIAAQIALDIEHGRQPIINLPPPEGILKHE